MHSVICGGARFEPSKVVCIGKNFSDHVREMGGSTLPPEPIVFLKPNSAIVSSPETVAIPAALGLLHHEVELCVMAGARAKALSLEEAEHLIAGYGVAIDFAVWSRDDHLCVTFGHVSPLTRTSPSTGIPGLANPKPDFNCSLMPTTCLTRSSRK